MLLESKFTFIECQITAGCGKNVASPNSIEGPQITVLNNGCEFTVTIKCTPNKRRRKSVDVEALKRDWALEM